MPASEQATAWHEFTAKANRLKPAAVTAATFITCVILTGCHRCAWQETMASTFGRSSADKLARTQTSVAELHEPPAELKKAFSADDPLFEPLPKPGPDDWLANFHEAGQTFDEYVQSQPLKPAEAKAVLYLQPLGKFSGNDAPSLATLRDFSAAFFQVPTKVLPPLALEGISSRLNPHTERRQYLSSDIHDLLAGEFPDDALAVVGITMEDLSTKSSNGQWWNFVFGEADIERHVGVYSFARFDPAFFGEERPPDFRQLVLKRSCATIAHETSHIFGIDHCIYFQCLMNGSNNLEESDRQPMHLCPIDLRKLHYSIGFNVVKRYERLRKFYYSVGVKDEVEWLDRRLAGLKPGRQ
jgi:archaemetzincin